MANLEIGNGRSARLERLVIRTPCEESWDEMRGDAAERHCERCQKRVYDFARLTAGEIEARIQAHRGHLCARLTHRDGRLAYLPDLAADPESSASQIARASSANASTLLSRERRASSIAATFVTAWLGVGTAPAATYSPNDLLPLGTLRKGEAEGEDLESPLPIAYPALPENAAMALRDEVDVNGNVPFNSQRYGMLYPARIALWERFDESDLVASATAGESREVSRQGSLIEVETELRIDEIVRGQLAARTVAYRHFESADPADPSDPEPTASDLEGDTPPGAEVLAFLIATPEVRGRQGEPVYRAATPIQSLLAFAEPSARAVYLERLEALGRLRSRQRILETEPIEGTTLETLRRERENDEWMEWLVDTAAEPATRLESLWTIRRAVEESAANDLELSADNAELGSVEKPAARPAEDLAEAPENEAHPPLGASFERGHRHRLESALLAASGLESANLELASLVYKWDQATAVAWLARELRIDGPPEEEPAIWLSSDLLEEIEEGDELSALVLAAQEREHQLTPSPNVAGPEAEARAIERRAAIRRNLRHRLAAILEARR